MSKILKSQGMRRCDGCHHSENDHDITFKQCSGCTKKGSVAPALYCSVECQRKDWATHKKTCGKNAPEASNQQDWAAKYRKTQVRLTACRSSALIPTR